MLHHRIFSSMIPFCAAIVILTACDAKRYFEENKPIVKGIWKAEEKAHFDIQITDTVARYNFFLNVRNSLDYPYSNLYLFIHTTNPTGKKSQDTLECQLADYTGKWLGSGFGSIKFSRFLIQKRVHFRQRGHYIFELEQAMRVKELKGIVDVGIRIEKEPH
jgi:gliding motility-associated lipoprotein GldH